MFYSELEEVLTGTKLPFNSKPEYSGWVVVEIYPTTDEYEWSSAVITVTLKDPVTGDTIDLEHEEEDEQ